MVQCQDLQELVAQNKDVFSDQPGHTQVTQHHVNTKPEKKVKLCPYQVPEAQKVYPWSTLMYVSIAVVRMTAMK